MNIKEAEELLNKQSGPRVQKKSSTTDSLDIRVTITTYYRDIEAIIIVVIAVIVHFLFGEIGQLLGLFTLLSPILLIALLLWLLNYLTDKEKFKRDSKRVFDVWLFIIISWTVLKFLIYPMYKLIIS